MTHGCKGLPGICKTHAGWQRGANVGRIWEGFKCFSRSGPHKLPLATLKKGQSYYAFALPVCADGSMTLSARKRERGIVKKAKAELAAEQASAQQRKHSLSKPEAGPLPEPLSDSNANGLGKQATPRPKELSSPDPERPAPGAVKPRQSKAAANTGDAQMNGHGPAGHRLYKKRRKSIKQ